MRIAPICYATSNNYGNYNKKNVSFGITANKSLIDFLNNFKSHKDFYKVKNAFQTIQQELKRVAQFNDELVLGYETPIESVHTLIVRHKKFVYPQNYSESGEIDFINTLVGFLDKFKTRENVDTYIDRAIHPKEYGIPNSD